MAYAKIENKIVVFKTYEIDETLTEIPDDVCCGMIQNDDMSFSTPPKTNEVLLEELRDKRDQLLSRTDIFALSDRELSDEMKKYRQDLRDLPSTASPELDENGHLTNVIWPTKPG